MVLAVPSVFFRRLLKLLSLSLLPVLLGSLLIVPVTPADPLRVQWKDVTSTAGIRWVHDNGRTPEKHLIEVMGGGGAFLDFDNDGRLDIYLVNSGLHRYSAPAAPAGPGSSTPARNALYRNNGDGTFSDVTARAGVSGSGYGMGVAVGDFDSDGSADIYVTQFGKNILYRNRADGTFEDVTGKAGVAVNGWSTSAAFFDYDNDGRLDLFVCRYLDWDYDKNLYCGEQRDGYRSYCHPDYFEPVASLLFRNNGDGTFTDSSRRAGVDLPGKGLGVVAADMDADGWTDLYVANDAVPNFLFRNTRSGTFEELGLVAGVAYGTNGKAASGMGTDFGDFDGDGRLDLVVTNIDNEMHNLYSFRAADRFADVTIGSGLGQLTLPYSGFGVRFLDYDNDGDLDLVILNGHVVDNIDLYRPRITFAEVPLLLENIGGKFVDAAEGSGEIWKRPMVGRALATGDYDNDGDSDLLIVNNGQPPVLLRNDGGNRNAWLGLHLIGARGNRDSVGATVTLETNRRRIVRQRQGGGSYHAAHDPRLLFGLSDGEQPKRVQILWPGGPTQSLTPPALRAYHTVREPAGNSRAPFP